MSLSSDNFWIDLEDIAAMQIEYSRSDGYYNLNIYLKSGQIMAIEKYARHDLAKTELNRLKKLLEEKKVNHHRMITTMWYAPGMPGALQAERDFHQLQNAISSPLDEEKK